jgi:hypothetical protein
VKRAGIGLVAVLVVVALVIAAAAFAGGGGKPAPKSQPKSHRGGGEHEHEGNAVTAYAYVIPGEVSLNVKPMLVAARTRNFVSVTETSPGVYCLTPTHAVDAAHKSWTVTPEAARSTVPTHAMFAYADTGSCASNQVGVRTYALVGGVAVPSENVAFMVVVG